MLNHRLPLALVACTALLAGCININNNYGPTAVASVAPVAPAARQGVTITGQVIGAPGMVAAGGGNVIVDNAGNLLAPKTGSVVGNHGGGVVGNHGGGLAPQAFALRATTDVPIAGAVVELANAQGQPLSGVAQVMTDPEGRYQITGVPTGVAFVVQSHVATAAGKPARLLSLARPTDAGGEVDLSLATTCVTAAVLDGPAANLAGFAAAPFQQAVAAAHSGSETRSWPDVSDRDAVLDFMGLLLDQVPAARDALNLVRRDLGLAPATQAPQAPLPPGSSPSSLPAPAAPTPTPTPGEDFFTSLPHVKLAARPDTDAYPHAMMRFPHGGGAFAAIRLRIGATGGEPLGLLAVAIHAAGADGSPAGPAIARQVLAAKDIVPDRGDNQATLVAFASASASAGAHVYVFSATQGQLGLRTSVFGPEGVGEAFVAAEPDLAVARWFELRDAGTMYVDID